jgi:single-strand DNA-binding protein
MNVLCFIGRIGKDCETRHTAAGDAVTSFTAAMDSGYGDKKVTTWLNCSIWGKRGEAVAPYLLKGTQIGVSGELTNREYTDKEGNKRYSLDVRVNDVTLVGSKSGGTAAMNEPKQEAKPEKAKEPEIDDDIPF